MQNAFSFEVSGISYPEKTEMPNYAHINLKRFYTSCENLRSFQQKLPKLLGYKRGSTISEHPVYQHGNAQIVSNYGPMSVLSAFSKILEKIVHKHILILS